MESFLSTGPPSATPYIASNGPKIFSPPSGKPKALLFGEKGFRFRWFSPIPYVPMPSFARCNILSHDRFANAFLKNKLKPSPGTVTLRD